MIYGLLPVGGEGVRLSLPFSKEMLPQKNYDYYNPIINHVVEKMLLAGAEKIYFIHGASYKKEIKNFYQEDEYVHILQKSVGFANIIGDFYETARPENKDKILFGLPDSIFNKNPFVRLLNEEGIVCGLFKTEDCAKVDRLDLEKKYFQVKAEKKDSNLNLFWGALKFDGKDIGKIIEDKCLDKTSEIGQILNSYPKSFIECGDYLDLGTWDNYNKYLQANEKDNTEIEVKYNASEINEKEFIKILKKTNHERYFVTDSKDYYFEPNNPHIEFVRYREGDGADSRSDITIKNFNNSAFNRFELELIIDQSTPMEDALYFLSLLKCKFAFSVRKKCHIFKFKDYTIVFYTLFVDNGEYKIVEIELEGGNYNLISEARDLLKKLKNFKEAKVIKESKFQLIKELLFG